MRIFAPLLALACLAPGACKAQPDNPLLGSWRFASTTEQDGPSACPSVFVFTAQRATITHPANTVYPQGAVSNMAVTYVPAPTLVTVMTNAAGYVEYNFTDRNHMYTENPWGKCFYARG